MDYYFSTYYISFLVKLSLFTKKIHQKKIVQ